jgi:hypothetical protein
MDRQPVRIVVYAWGQSYVDRLLNYAVASLLAPGNLPALVDGFDCTLVVVTEEKLFAYVTSHPLIERARSLCAVRLISLDDAIGEPWQYGMSVAYALFRGFADLGPAMTETYMLFLNADFALADGCYKRLIPYLKRGDRVILSPSYCVVEEEVEPLLRRIRDDGNGVLAIPPRQLARMIIDHRHNTVRAKTISQHSIHFEYMDQAYWQVDQDTIIGHQMPICMVAMRPERALADINTFWDWGVVYDFCPSQNVTVIGDSDEFLILELRSEHAHLDLMRAGPTTALAAASRMTGYITQYQLDNARFPLTLHAESLRPGIDEGRVSLHAFFAEVIGQLLGRVLDHRNHPQWIYHRWHLSRHINVRRLRAEIAAIDEENAKALARTRTMQDGALVMLAITMAPEFAATRRQMDDGSVASVASAVGKSFRSRGALTAIAEKFVQEADAVAGCFREVADRSAARRQELGDELRRELAAMEQCSILSWDDVGYCGVPAPALAARDSVSSRPGARLRSRASHILGQMDVWVFGAVPHTRPWHRLHFICKAIAGPLDRAARSGSRLLLVGGQQGIVHDWTDPMGRRHLRLSPAGVLNGALDMVAASIRFGFCLVELDRDTFGRIREFHRILATRLEPGASAVMCWINSACESNESLQPAFAQCALMASEGAVVRFFSAASGWGGLGTTRAEQESSGRLRRWVRHGAGRLDGFAQIAGRRATEGQSPRGNCWGAIVEFDAQDRSGVSLQASSSATVIRSAAKAAEVGATL